MAKSAKQPIDAVLTDKAAEKFRREILERYERIESERGKFMRAAQREREAMTTIYEGLTAFGVPQRVSRTNIKIVRALEKIKAWMAELEADEAAMARKLAKAQHDKQQLALFSELPRQDKPKKEKSPKDVLPEQDKKWAEADPIGNA